MSKTEFAHLYTPDGETLSGTPWNTYPRPQLRRNSFLCLNGQWEFAVTKTDEFPTQYPEAIRVPFAPESLLSGVHRGIKQHSRLFYRRIFSLPDGFQKGRVLLHFGAADQIATVYLNGQELGPHRGGYTPFSFDITDHLQGENTLVVRVTDELHKKILPYGKQCEKRGGMWYTPVSGLWQTVWLESVPDTYIRSLRIQTGDTDVRLTAEGVDTGTVTICTPTGELTAPMLRGRAHIVLSSPRHWSPEDPYLYTFTIQAGEDVIHSYFALRTLSVETVNGLPRLCLNGKPYFFHALLDQGYYSDGLFTPATPSGYEQDILAMKELGFNTLRKHIKVEPEQFYYDCDRLGMIVFQDMVNNGSYSFLRDTALPTIGMKRLNDKHMHRHAATRHAFLEGMEQTVQQLYNHPCICYWTIFNEGWGQFDSAAAYERLKHLDNSRFIDTASGWFAGAPSDVESPHIYFKPITLPKTEKPLVLSEFGGYSYKPAGHVFNTKKTYGYRFFTEQAAFEDALEALYTNEVIPAVKQGLCAAVYTQVSDVEDETNGLLSYDRRVCKVSPERMRRIAQQLTDEIQ
ncbi:MAG: glycoside hydrolase family 2 [Clostridia bacterium]|nr:glycoside hydrolase family 2 [Clostridia bacterium]